MKTSKKILTFLLLSLITPTLILAQDTEPNIQHGDSLSLEWIIREVVSSHPMVKSAQEDLNKADAQIGLARSGYYPNVGFSANVNTVGPVPSLSIPDMGTFHFVPRNNYSGVFSVHQNIYDFGKTDRNVALASESKKLSETSVEQVKQSLSIRAIQVYYTLEYLQEAIKIKEEQLRTLNEHLDFVLKRKETGSATDFEVLSTKVKISAIESQRLDLEVSREVQLSELNALLGLPAETPHVVQESIKVIQTTVPADSMLVYAFRNRNEMLLAKEKEQLAGMKVEQVKQQNNPSLFFTANGGARNGYIPETKKIKANYVVGLGINIPIFDATRKKYNVLKASSTVEATSLETEITRRKISSDVVESESRLRTASKKIAQAGLQLQQAEEALQLAEVSYEAGVITNLDLLDANTAVSESRLLLLKSRIDYVVNVYRLSASLGEKLY